MNTLLQDIRFGIRLARKNLTVSAIAALALTLGIGLTATMFSIVYGALLRGLPYEESDRIVHVEQNNLSMDYQSLEVSVHDYIDIRDEQRSFEELAAWYGGTVNVSGSEKPERFNGAFITGNAFKLLGVRAMLGRTLQPADDEIGAERVILLGHKVWAERFSGDSSIVGKSVRANGIPMTVVGVMPEGFLFPILHEVWVPLRPDPLAEPRGEGQTLEVFGRLRDGVSIDGAMVDLTAISKRLEAEYPETNKGRGIVMKKYVDEYIGDEPQTLLYTMLGAVFLVLLMACANVANLLLSRAAARSKEVAIRTAMGASRWRVVIQFLSESFVLSAIGAVMGTLFAWIGVRLFNNAIAGTDPPFWIQIRLDGPVLLFVVALTLVTSIVAGLLPALSATRANVNEILKDEARGSSSFRIGRLSRALVMFEIALSCALLVAAGLTIKSIRNMGSVDYGFATEEVLTARIGLPEATYADTIRQVQFWEQLMPRVAAIPGVEAATLGTSMPGLYAYGSQIAIDGKTYTDDKDFPFSRYVVITPDFFNTFGKRLREGRLFTGMDRYGSLPVALVNESFVRTHFDGQSPIGRRVRLGDNDSEQPWLTVVGVVPDMYLSGGTNEEPEGIYLPVAQNAQRFMTVMLKVRGSAGTVTNPLRQVVAGVDSDLPIYFVQTVREAIDDNNWFYRVFGGLFMIFGIAALFLAGIGLYGVMATSVSQRTREVGVRMALGAQPGHVLRMIFRQGAFQLAIGLLLGLGMAAGLSRLLSMILYDVNPRDPVVFITIVLVLSAATAIACLIPARRATRVDPVIALRYD